MISKIVTLIVLVPFMTIFFWIGSLVVGGAVAGSLATAGKGDLTYEQEYEIGFEAGRKFGENWTAPLLLISFVVSVGGSAFLTFGEILPWCREVKQRDGKSTPSLPDAWDVD